MWYVIARENKDWTSYIQNQKPHLSVLQSKTLWFEWNGSRGWNCYKWPSIQLNGCSIKNSVITVVTSLAGLTLVTPPHSCVVLEQTPSSCSYIPQYSTQPLIYLVETDYDLYISDTTLHHLLVQAVQFKDYLYEKSFKST